LSVTQTRSSGHGSIPSRSFTAGPQKQPGELIESQDHPHTLRRTHACNHPILPR
jgi:hypothetical protein